VIPPRTLVGTHAPDDVPNLLVVEAPAVGALVRTDAGTRRIQQQEMES